MLRVSITLLMLKNSR